MLRTCALAIALVSCSEDQPIADAASDAMTSDVSIAPDVAQDTASTDVVIEAASDAALDAVGATDAPSEAASDAGVDAGPKIVFVSSVLYGANLGGLNGADTKCQALATAAGLPGNYKAWLSDDNTNASMRLAHSSGAYVLYDGVTVVANDWAGLTSGTLKHAIDRTEDGGTLQTPQVCLGQGPIVYSNTHLNGTQDAVGFNCTNWTGVGTKVNFGNANATDLHWTTFCSANASMYCDGTNLASIYCVQQ